MYDGQIDRLVTVLLHRYFNHTIQRRLPCAGSFRHAQVAILQHRDGPHIERRSQSGLQSLYAARQFGILQRIEREDHANIVFDVIKVLHNLIHAFASAFLTMYFATHQANSQRTTG